MNARIPPKLTVAQQKALDHEIRKQTLESVKKLEKNLTALVLYSLHTYPNTKWGKKRLLEFYEVFRKNLRKLEEYYEMRNGDDSAFLFKMLLKSETGIVVDDLPGTMFDFEVRIKED